MQETKGGTIFIDELHDLDKVSVDYLRKVLDRGRPIPLAAGEGPSLIPDVRLIFATFRNIEELQKEKRLPLDFVRRLRKRYLTVPPMKARKEDIPLFVEAFREKCKTEDDFLLALLLHDWEEGQVDGLIYAIRAVVAKKRRIGKLVAADLRGHVPDPIIECVTTTPRQEVSRTLYSFLIDTLKLQGFSRGGRGGGLQKRLAELMSVSPATISRVVADLKLVDSL